MGKFRWPTTGKPPLTAADRKKKQADYMKALRKARAEGRPVPKYNSKGPPTAGRTRKRSPSLAEIDKAERTLEEIEKIDAYWALAKQDDES